MLREAMESAYTRSVGAAWNGAAGLFSSVADSGKWLQTIYVIIMVAVMAGFVNALVYPVPNQTYISFPNSASETIPEAVVDSFVIAAGGGGIYLALQSGKLTTRSRDVNLYLGLALLLLVVSVFAGIDMAILKGFG